MLTQQKLKELLHYDPDTGKFFWMAPRCFGKIAAGSEAGSIDGGYIRISVSNRLFYAHKLAWLAMTGEWPKLSVDHIDGNGLNNAWTNLREATHKQNCENIKLPSNNTSGYRGVYLCKPSGKYQVKVMHNGKSISFGYFCDREDAAEAAKTARAQLFTHDHGRAP